MERVRIINSSMTKLSEIVQDLWGWGIIVVSFIGTYLSGASSIFYGVFTLIFLDACFGVAVAIKQGRFFLSYLGRETFVKMLFYYPIIVGFYVAETTLPGDFFVATPTVAAATCGIEIWSMLGSISILSPKFPLALLLRRSLKGEIARKLNIQPDEVERMLEGL